jgi:hypothetical protein
MLVKMILEHVCLPDRSFILDVKGPGVAHTEVPVTSVVGLEGKG